MIFSKKGYKNTEESFIICECAKSPLKLQEEIVMKVLKRMAVLALVVLALGGCTKSSISTEAPVGEEEIDPAKLADMEDEDETLAREDNILIDDETEEKSLYEWDQVKDEADELFSDADLFPQTVKMEFTADEDAMAINLKWVLKNGTAEDEAMEYAAIMVKRFNDIVAVQSLDLESSTDTSFGTLWNQFALTVQVGTEDGKWIVDKSYKAGAKIDLTMPENNDEGPEDVEENVPKKA